MFKTAKAPTILIVLEKLGKVVIATAGLAIAWYGWAEPYTRSIHQENIAHLEQPQGIRAALIGEMKVTLRNICKIPELEKSDFPRPIVSNLSSLELKTPVYDKLISKLPVLDAHEQELLSQTALSARMAQKLGSRLKEPQTTDESVEVIEEIQSIFRAYRENLRLSLKVMETYHELTGEMIDVLNETNGYKRPKSTLTVKSLTKDCRDNL